MNQPWRALALLLTTVLSGACELGADPHDNANQSAIISGTAISNPAQVEATKVVHIQNLQTIGGSTKICLQGSGTLLTNDWVLTAAHVVDPCPADMPAGCVAPVLPADYDVTLGNFSAGDQSRTPNGALFHPRWSGGCVGRTDTDVALVHLSSPFVLGGSTTGHKRPISDLDTLSLIQKSTTCYGYGRFTRTGVAGPPLRFASFLVTPVAPIPVVNGPIVDFAFSVMKGGALTPNDTGSPGTDIIPHHGDSGGPCIDPTDPFPGQEDVWGVMQSADPRVNTSGEEDPRFAIMVAASAFRDFARAALAANAPPVLFDIDFDGLPDNFTMTQSGGFLFITVQATTAGTFTLAPVPVLPGIGSNRALVAHGDFDDNGVEDLFGYINGTPLYYPGVSGFDPLAPLSTSLNLVSTYEYFTPGDFNKDGVDDVVGVRADASEDIYLGQQSVGLTNPAFLVPRGFNFFGPTDEESFAIGAPGTELSNLQLNVGAVYLFSTDAAKTNYVDLFTLDWFADPGQPLAELGDLFGAQLAWGRFDGDVTRHGLVIAAPGKTVGGTSGVVAYVKILSSSESLGVVLKASDFGDTTTGALRFGRALSTGNFNGDARDDLAVGASDRVFILSGVDADGIGTSSPHVLLEPTDFGLPSTGTGFGNELATGDFNCDGYEDLAIGAPGTTVGTSLAAGAVIINYGGSNGIVKPVTQGVGTWKRVDQSAAGIGDGPEQAEFFGGVLAAGNFNGDSYKGRPCIDLAVHSEESATPPAAISQGAVNVVFGGPGGLSAAGSQTLERAGTILGGKILGTPGPNAFGGSLAITAADTDTFDDLIIGAWNTDFGKGEAHVLRGSGPGVTAVGQALWRQGVGGIPDQGETLGNNPLATGDRFGMMVGGTSNGLIGISAPWESFDGDNPGDPTFDQAGWATLIRTVDQQGSIAINQSVGPVAVTERSLSKPPQFTSDYREDAFFGASITAARPAFVPVGTLPPRYGGTLVISDGGGRIGGACVTDSTPPVIHSVTISPSCLWPPNKKLVPYRLRDELLVSLHDNCDIAPSVQVLGVQVVDSGKIKAQPFVFGQNGLCLRSDRAGNGAGRDYIVTVQARDGHGNATTASVTVHVPHNGGCAGPAPAFVSDADALCQF